MSAEVRELITGNIEFSGLERERVVVLDSERLSELVDVNLQLYSGPAVAPLLRTMSLSGGEDFRLYLNSHNVTEQLVDVIREKVQSTPDEVMEDGYRKGVEAYFRLFKRLQFDEEVYERDSKLVDEVIASSEWEGQFEKLGDRSIGWSGNLHCFNFLYKFISISSISLNSVWSKYQRTMGADPTLLSDEKSLTITFSQGPAPFLEDFDPKSFVPSGRLEYSIELLHKNPLEPILKRISENLRRVEKKLEQQRVSYLTPIKSTVEVTKEDIKLGNLDSEEALKQIMIAIRNL